MLTFIDKSYILPILMFCISFHANKGFTQQADPRLISYPDVILLNGNIVSMDDAGVNENIGSVYEAIAVRNGRILDLGTSLDIQTLAGPETTVYDLNGRTVIPGIIDTHTHLPGYADGHWTPPMESDYTIEREEEDSWEDIVNKILALAAEVKQTHEPGEWIFIEIPRWKIDGVSKAAAWRVDRVLTRHMLDEVNTEQLIQITGSRGTFNTPAQERYCSLFGGECPDMFPDDGIILSGTVGRAVRGGDALPVRFQKAMMEQEFLEWTAYGITTFSSRIAPYKQDAALAALDLENRMPLRFAYAWGPSYYRTMSLHPNYQADLSERGSNWLWLNGVSTSSGDGAYPLLATTIEARPEIKERELMRDRIRFVKDFSAKGLRWTNAHIAGDRTLDVAMDMIEAGASEAGFSLEDVRSKHHVADHCRVNPRPEQIPRLKKLGMIMSCAPKYIESNSPEVAEDYGEEYLSWMVPMRSLIEGGVHTVFESDTHEVAGRGIFYYIGQFVNRRGVGETFDMVYAPEQRINRIWALKTATVWASDYVLKEDEIGTLEEGKFADLIVLNKNYFDEDAVPDLMIKTVRPLLTIIGGHTRFLDESLAADLGVDPEGIQPEQVIRQLNSWEAGEGILASEF